MISAKEAKNKTIIKSGCLKTLELLEIEINHQIEKGKYTASVKLLYEKGEVIAMLTEHLKNLGYRVYYTPASPLPDGCPSDQRDSHSTLSVIWE